MIDNNSPDSAEWNAETAVYRGIFMAFGIAGIICNAILLYLIVDMKSWNNYMILIFTTGCLQFAYDALSILFWLKYVSIFSGYGYIVAVRVLFENVCFSVSTLVALSVFFLLKYRKEFPLLEYKTFSLTYCLGPNIAWFIVIFYGFFSNSISPLEKRQLVNQGLNVSFGIRCFYMIYNIINFMFCDYLVEELRKDNLSIGFDKATPQETAIRTLVGRIKLYPVVQVCSRFFSIIFIPEFGENRDVYIPWGAPITKWRYILRLLANATTFFNSIGTLIVFLLVQPQAAQHLRDKFCRKSKKFVGEEDVDSAESSTLPPYDRESPSVLFSSQKETTTFSITSEDALDNSAIGRQSLNISPSSKRDTETEFKKYTEEELLGVITSTRSQGRASEKEKENNITNFSLGGSSLGYIPPTLGSTKVVTSAIHTDR